MVRFLSECCDLTISHEILSNIIVKSFKAYKNITWKILFLGPMINFRYYNSRLMTVTLVSSTSQGISTIQNPKD